MSGYPWWWDYYPNDAKLVQCLCAHDGTEREVQMDREKALELLADVHNDERFAGVLGKVQIYAAGRTHTKEYWIVRVARLEARHPQWVYCDTPGDFHRMQQEANGD